MLTPPPAGLIRHKLWGTNNNLTNFQKRARYAKFIVFDHSQILMCYLLNIKFNKTKVLVWWLRRVAVILHGIIIVSLGQIGLMMGSVAWSIKLFFISSFFWPTTAVLGPTVDPIKMPPPPPDITCRRRSGSVRLRSCCLFICLVQKIHLWPGPIIKNLLRTWIPGGDSQLPLFRYTVRTTRATKERLGFLFRNTLCAVPHLSKTSRLIKNVNFSLKKVKWILNGASSSLGTSYSSTSPVCNLASRKHG